MEITLGVGIAKARFGMTVDEILIHLGDPDRDYVEDDGDRCLCFNRLGLVLKLEDTERLGWILVLNPEARLFDCNPIGMQFSEFEAIVDKHLKESKERENFGYWGSTTWEDSWLEVQHALGKVQQINFGVRFDSDDEPLWPK